MTAADIIAELTALGAQLWTESGDLRFRAPRGVLTDDRKARLRAHKAEVIALLDRADTTVTPDPASRHDPFPLTDVQTAYLLGRQDSFGYGGVACHGYLELAHPGVDTARLASAWNALIARHDMLRAVVEADGYQRVLAEVPTFDVRVVTPSDVESHLAAVRADMGHRMYDTTKWPLHDLRVTRTVDGDILHFSMDSLIADWASAGILFDELDRLLAGETLPDLDITFRDYLIAERGLRETPRYQRDRAYWLGKVDDLPAAPELPVLSTPPGNRFTRHTVRLDAQQWDRLRAEAASRGATASTAVLVAYAAVLGRWSRRSRFSLTLTLLNRLPLHPQVDRLVGDFTSVTPLAVEPEDTVAALAADLGARLFADLDHRLFSGVEVLREVARRRGRDAALLPVVFTSAIGMGADRPIAHGITQTPQVLLDCQVADGPDGLTANWDVRDGVFPDGLVEDMADAFARLLAALADGSGWDAADPAPLPGWQRSERATANDTAAPIEPALLHAGVVAAAHRTPDAPAVITTSGTTTFAELVGTAAGVAARLDIDPGERVAVVMEKGAAQIAAVLGVLLAGGVYLPVDVSQPALRREKMLAGVRHVLTGVDGVAPLPEVPSGDVDTAAYVIYTSGSTGNPKGVVISHRSAWNTIADINARFDVTAEDRVLGLAQLGFDLSVYDIFGVLAAGGALVLPDADRAADPSHWAELVARHRVTLWNTVPAQLQMLAHYLDSDPAPLPLRLALLSGDWIPVTLPDHIRSHVPSLVPVSLGGATEAAIWSIWHPIEKVDPGLPSIPYGVPLANQGFRVLDERGRDTPVWVPGELHISGVGLAQGYFGDQDLTAARFPVVDGERLYRTGDLGRYLPGGEIEFLGREDDQVKIRGHRIELGEVEAALLAHPAVGAAAAVVSGTGPLDRALLGFVTPAPRDPDPADHDRLVRTARAFADKQVGDLDIDRVSAHVRALHRASLLAIRQHLATSPQVAPQHRWLVDRWTALVADLPADEAPDWDAVERGVADGLCTADYVRYHRVHAERLGELLAGEQNPFELLFPEGRMDLAAAIYRDDLASRYLNHAAAALINRIAAAHDGTVRVLEVGAGTGAASSAVIPVLDGYDVDYLYTDVTAFFLADARARHADRPWVRHALFDIDRDPREQGITPNSADVVLCAGVLNSTAAPAAAIRAAAELLAPGGWLVLTEPTDEHPNILLTQGFMMTPDAVGRTPLLQVARWRELIEAAGGEVVLCLPEDRHPLAPQGMHVIAARFKTDRARITPEGITAFVEERLPAHMVPAHLQVVDALPLTANGKVDRRALAAWRPAAVESGAPDDAPSGDLEARLCALWADALGIARIGPEENFYQRGADSLVLARVAGRLREEVPEAAGFAYDTLLRHMLNEPTVAVLARFLRGSAPAETTVEVATVARVREGSNALLVDFGGGQDGPARVLFHAALGTLDYFQSLGKALADQRLGPVIGVAVHDPDAYLAHDPKQLLDRVADDYADRLAAEGLTRFQLVGYCLGGLLATEVGRRLLDRGLLVSDLTLVDSIPMFLDTDEELAFEAIFVPNLNLDPVAAVFGPDVDGADLVRAIDQLMTTNGGVRAGDLAALTGDPGFEALSAAVRARTALGQDARLAEYAAAAASQAGVPVDPELVPSLFRMCRHSMRAAVYEPDPYFGDMTFLRAAEAQSFGVSAGVGHLAAPFWNRTCLGEFRVIDVPGNHFSVIEPPNLDVVVEHLAAPLRGGQS